MLLIPGFGIPLAICFGFVGAGKVQKLVLDQNGITSRNWWSKKYYRWNEIDDFKLYKLKSGFITAATMVSFTPINKEGKVWTKVAKALSGGTHSIPALGIPAKTLATLMYAYKQGLIVNDEIIAKVLGKTKFTKGEAMSAPSGVPAGQTERASPGKPARVSLGAPKGDMSAVDLAMRRAAAERGGSHSQVANPVPAPAAKPAFGKAKSMAQPRATFGKSPSATPLVQDSSARRRRVSK